jgi:hypothetical protein
VTGNLVHAPYRVRLMNGLERVDPILKPLLLGKLVVPCTWLRFRKRTLWDSCTISMILRIQCWNKSFIYLKLPKTRMLEWPMRTEPLGKWTMRRFCSSPRIRAPQESLLYCLQELGLPPFRTGSSIVQQRLLKMIPIPGRAPMLGRDWAWFCWSWHSVTCSLPFESPGFLGYCFSSYSSE